MSRINTNVQSMVAQHVLGRQTKAVQTSLERLSTGLAINTGKDSPAGLIASESLRGEVAGTTQAITNAQRADSVMGTAEGALNEVSSLLVQMQTLVTDTANSGGLTTQEVNANQQQVDAILTSIDRIANSTQFSGKKLLDGSMDYTTSSVSGTNLATVKVNSAALTAGVAKTVLVNVTASAQYAHLAFHSAAGGLTGNTTIQVAGNSGSQILTFGGATTIASIKTAVNALTSVTGVSATIVSSALNFNSTGWGSEAFVSVGAIQGTFTTDVARDTGRDPTVKVNGTTAQASGLDVSLRSSSLDMDLGLKSAFAGVVGSTTFYVTGGGANFMIGGNVNVTNTASIGLASTTTGSLGDANGMLASLASGGANSLAGDNAINAQKIVEAAVSQVSNLRGRIGAFQKFTLDPTINSLQVALENASSAQSAIRDTDFAAETASLTRNQILSQAATNVLAMANAAPQSVLSLLK